MQKARRGELVNLVPAGYVRRPSGEVSFDPDEHVQAVVRAVFEQFERLGSVGAVLRYLLANRMQLPVRASSGPDSLQVAADWKKERQEADDQWQYRLQRGQYEADRARRQYHAVEPENRLVCRTLELEWEQKLRAHREFQEAYERFQQDEPKLLTLAEQDAIRQLATDVPAIWQAATTTDAERIGILRQILDKVVIQIEGQSEWIEARLHWAGGHQTYTRFRRAVGKLTQLSEWPELQPRILALKAEGRTAQEIAEQLNREGRTSPHLKAFTASTIRAALSRRGLTAVRRGTTAEPIALAEGERFASDLARELGVRPQFVYAWIKSGRLPGRQAGGTQGRWIVRADASVMATLKASEEGPTRQKPISKPAQV